MPRTENNIEQLLLQEYGVVIGGRHLRKVLGFESASAFGRAVRSGHMNLNFFELPGRKGRFVLVTELAGWLKTASGRGIQRNSTEVPQTPKKEGTQM